MKATVDSNLCIGCGICEQICDAIFEMNGDIVKVKGESVPTDEKTSCQEAADACPVDAIAITD